MEISITEEQSHLIDMATKNAMESLFETGNVLPTALVMDDERVNFYSFEVGSLDAVRGAIRKTIGEKCPNGWAYAFFYDSTLEQDGQDVDVLIIETADAEDEYSLELGIVYDRAKKTHCELQYVGKTDSLLRPHEQNFPKIDE